MLVRPRTVLITTKQQNRDSNNPASKGWCRSESKKTLLELQVVPFQGVDNKGNYYYSKSLSRSLIANLLLRI